MSAGIVIPFLIASGIIFWLVYGLTRHVAHVDDGMLTIRSIFLGIPSWTYRCPVTDVQSYKYPASILDMGLAGGHVWGRPWSAGGIVFKFKKPWWIFRRAFLWCPEVAAIAEELRRLRPDLP